MSWIWKDKSDGKLKDNEIVSFRKVVRSKKKGQKAIVHVSADAKYKLFVNGTLVHIGPQKGDHQIHYYDVLDLGPYYEDGDNVVLIRVLAIPNEHNKGNHGFHRTDSPGLYLSGELEGDHTWKYFKEKVHMEPENPRFAPLYILEKSQGLGALVGCHHVEYDDSKWSQARKYEPFELPPILRPDYMVRRQIPLIPVRPKRFEHVEKVVLSQPSDEAWNGLLQESKSIKVGPNTRSVIEISAGPETTGYLSLLMGKGQDAEINILTSECYAYEPEEEGPFSMPRKGDRTDSVNGKLFGFTDTYMVAGQGSSQSPEIYEPFWFRTFRYIQLEIITKDQELDIYDFSYEETGYPLDVQSQVETSDASMEAIWDISERSLKLCMHETYEDCPFYEQLQYAMDSRSQILYTYATAADDRLARQCMDDFRRAGKHDGMINCSYPNYESNVIPGFSIYYIGMVYDHMMYFGDKPLVMKHLPTILGILNFFRSRLDQRGMVEKLGGPLFRSKYWSFIDWTDQWRETAGVPLATHEGPLTMESLLYVMGLQYSAKLLDFIGYDQMSRQFLSEAKMLQEAINTHARGKDGMLQDGPGFEGYSQHTQVFGVLTETINLEEGARYIKETLNNPDLYAQCSVAMMFYLFRALEKCQMYEETHDLWDIWRDMVAKNLTTCEEDSVMSRSDCHAWGALALYELPSVVLGVRPVKPGCEEISINPVPGVLDWAQGQVMTPKGLVKVSWKRSTTGLNIQAQVPKSMKIDAGGHKHLEIHVSEE